MKKAFIVTGLGFGDEGKGTVTNWLSYRHNAHTVIRTGGPQALHHVVTESGQKHVFSQFGSGTLRGSATHLSKHMVIDPYAILKEGEALTYGAGIRGVFDMMTIHEDALVITPFQAVAGRVRELLRKNRQSSVGIGVGETILDSETLQDKAVRAKDLEDPSVLGEKLRHIKSYKWTEFEEHADRASNIVSGTKEVVQAELREMEDDDAINWALEYFGELNKKVRIVDTEYVAKHVLGSDGTVVFEGSQGVLLDRYKGFHPYTTKVRTIPKFSKEILEECNYRGDTESLGVLRAYHTRHGNGPFVSECTNLTAELPDEVNKNHRWQGKFRVGHFDTVAARYAIEASGVRGVDSLVVTCFDRVLPLKSWQICNAYTTESNDLETKSMFQFEADKIVGIKTYEGENECASLERQEKVGQFLGGCHPQLEALDVSSCSQDDLISLCKGTLEERLHVPVVAVSLGQTEQDKIEI